MPDAKLNPTVTNKPAPLTGAATTPDQDAGLHDEVRALDKLLLEKTGAADKLKEEIRDLRKRRDFVAAQHGAAKKLADMPEVERNAVLQHAMANAKQISGAGDVMTQAKVGTPGR